MDHRSDTITDQFLRWRYRFPRILYAGGWLHLKFCQRFASKLRIGFSHADTVDGLDQIYNKLIEIEVVEIL